jgi:N-acetylglucosamine-6-phosphate deacetylase
VAVIDLLQSSGIVVSAGHTNATYQQGTSSFDRIKVCTHLFNAMSAFQSREPGMVGAIFDHPSVKCSMVADGIHVDYASIRISKRILGDRMYLITDAVTETSKGPYQHIFRNDRYVVPDGTLSGSALTMMKAVKNCVDRVGIELTEALHMASLYPARVLGLEDEFGEIKRNSRASFAVFDNDLNIVSTIDLT